MIALQVLLHVGGRLALFVVDDAVPKPPHPVDFPLSLDSLGCLLSGPVIVCCSDFMEVRPEALLDLPGSLFHPQPELQILDHVLEMVEVHAHDSVVRQNLLELRELGPVFLDVEDHLAPPLDVLTLPGSPLIAVPDLVVAHLLLEAVSGSGVKTVYSVEVGAGIVRILHSLRALVVAAIGPGIEVLGCVHHRSTGGADQSALLVRRQPAVDALMHDGREQSGLVVLRRRILQGCFSALCGLGVPIVTPSVATRIEVLTLRIKRQILAFNISIIY